MDTLTERDDDSNTFEGMRVDSHSLRIKLVARQEMHGATRRVIAKVSTTNDIVFQIRFDTSESPVYRTELSAGEYTLEFDEANGHVTPVSPVP